MIQIISASGQVLLQKHINFDQGEQTLDWLLIGLPPGAYWVKSPGQAGYFLNLNSIFL
ncbi:MAG: hypothetical protein IPH16_19620 [Haliscomenobacter sp.]|nr:hypothetical protein [Haliscomenobacter sp.]